MLQVTVTLTFDLGIIYGSWPTKTRIMVSLSLIGFKLLREKGFHLGKISLKLRIRENIWIHPKTVVLLSSPGTFRLTETHVMYFLSLTVKPATLRAAVPCYPAVMSVRPAVCGWPGDCDASRSPRNWAASSHIEILATHNDDWWVSEYLLQGLMWLME